ncbi:MAG: hypothetical protein B7X10_04695, partial [Burkholderiales bacterium 21-58-4]
MPEVLQEKKDGKKYDEPDLKKGMYTVQNFADVLQTLAYMCSSTESEAIFEGDNSPVPGQLKDWLADGVKIFQAMSEEESNELLEGMQGSPFYLSGKNAGLEKAGARNSKADQEHLQAAHDHLVSMGAKCPSVPMDDAKDPPADNQDMGNKGVKAPEPSSTGPAGKADAADDLQKLDLGQIHKALVAAGSALAEIKTELAASKEENAALKAQVEKIAKMPQPMPGLLKVIGKGEDPDTAIEVEVQPGVHDPKRAEALIKQHGGK